jgi:hypothetical protein
MIMRVQRAIGGDFAHRDNFRCEVNQTASRYVAGTGPSFAVSPGTQGQPSQNCLSSTAPPEPGNASSAPGSAFNENGGIAGGVYAGNGAPSLNGNTDKAISQYDVACFQVSQH